MIEITEREISLEEMVQRAKGEGSGAIVTFLGTVRDDGIQMMEVEAFHEAAEAEIDLIRSEAMRSPTVGSARRSASRRWAVSRPRRVARTATRSS